MNRGQIRNLARKNLGETTAAFWTDAELNLYIDNAGHDIAEKAKCIKANGYLTTVLDQAEYHLASNFTGILSIQEVYMKESGTTWMKLKETTRKELDVLHSGWLSAASGTPTEYYEDIEEDVLRLFVPPDSANAGTNYLRVYYSKDYTDMAGDTSEPTGIARDLQLGMVDFVTAYGYQQRGWGDKANDSWTKYFQRLKDYIIERDREKEDREIIMKNYRNV